MDFRDKPDEASFRKEVRKFISTEAPKAIKGMSGEEALTANWQKNQEWFKKLADKGWIAPAWPTEYGGAGLSTMQQFVLNEELAINRVPRPLHLIIGLGMAGPTIITHGTEQQRQKYLPGILKGEDVWCQGYSEPGSGSDLASLQTNAVLDGDDYVINGQKIWTTPAHMARRMILLARLPLCWPVWTSNLGTPSVVSTEGIFDGFSVIIMSPTSRFRSSDIVIDVSARIPDTSSTAFAS